METLIIDGVHYTYPQSKIPVVVDWTDTFHAGTLTALTGESGCGKSTRLFLAALLLRPHAGSIIVNDTRVDNLRDADRAHIRAHNFGFIFQDSVLDNTRTVMDNVLESCLYRGTSAAESIPYAHELLERMRVTVPAHRRPGQISGGQAQRIAVCRALLGRPRVIFADEPTGNLDPESSQAVMNMLHEAAHDGACVIVVTHDPDVAQQADRWVQVPAPVADEVRYV